MSSSTNPRAIADNCMCLTVRRAARALSRRYDEAFRPLGITSGQFAILTAISAGRPIGVIKLADELGMDRTTLTAGAKTLERIGLIVSRADPEDGRGRRFQLTPQGRSVLDAAFPVWEQAQKSLAQHSTPADLDRLRAEIRALA